MRVYLPLTRLQVGTLRDGAVVEPPVTGFAVTGQLRAGHPQVDEEELEYEAYREAVAAAGDLGAAASGPGGTSDGPAAPRRIVAALELPRSCVRPPAGLHPDPGGEASAPEGSSREGERQLAQVLLVEPISADQLRAWHVDECPVEDPENDEDELQWYDVSEVDAVWALLA